MVNKGESLFLYTDGVTEAENVAKELYSDEYLLDFLAGCHQEKPTGIVEKVYADIERHALGAEQSDDITMMCVNYK